MASIAIMKLGPARRLTSTHRAGRLRRAEKAQPHVAILLEFIEIADLGVGLDDVGETCAGRDETGLDVPADPLDLAARVAPANMIVIGVAREPIRIILPVPHTVTTRV
jgi:hypothetical protein